ncbi:hypothetical protein OAF54_03205 [bacterium]|nr:hypothetical protein [bacterium]
MSSYFTDLMDAYYDKPFGKTEDQNALMMEQYIDATKDYEQVVQKEAWERMRITHPKRPPLTDIIKVMNQVKAEKIANKPVEKFPSDYELLQSPMGKKAWKSGFGRSYCVLCWQQKRHSLSEREVDAMIISEQKAIDNPIQDIKDGKYSLGMDKLADYIRVADNNFNNMFKSKMGPIK